MISLSKYLATVAAEKNAYLGTHCERLYVVLPENRKAKKNYSKFTLKVNVWIDRSHSALTNSLKHIAEITHTLITNVP